jgi:hypothetical protein
MGKIVYTSDNTYNYIIIFITILLAYGLYKIFNAVLKISEKLDKYGEKNKYKDPGPSNIIEEEIKSQAESLDVIEEDNNLE